jgi:hypothetical protein
MGIFGAQVTGVQGTETKTGFIAHEMKHWLDSSVVDKL